MEKKTSVVFIQGISILFLAAIILFGSTGSAYSDKPPGVTNDTIKVGVIYDQTGPLSPYLTVVTKGLRSLVQYTNEQGGINGRELKLLVEDDRCTIPGAVSAFKKLLYKDGVVTLLGPSMTASIVAMLRGIEKEKIVTIPGSITPKMVEPLHRYVFIIQDTTPGMMKALVDYIMLDLKAKNPRIGFVNPDNESGMADLVPGLERLKYYNLEPATKEVLNFGAIDATSQVMNLRRAKVDYVIICGQISDGAMLLLRDMKKFGLKVPVFGSWGTCNEVVMSIGEAAKEFYSVNAFASWYDKGPGIEKMREITLKYEPGTEKPWRGKLYTSGFATAAVFIEAMKRAGRDLNTEALVNSLEGMKNFDTGGLTGLISFSPTNHKGGNSWKIFKTDLSTGKLIPMTEWRTPK